MTAAAVTAAARAARALAVESTKRLTACTAGYRTSTSRSHAYTSWITTQPWKSEILLQEPLSCSLFCYLELMVEFGES